MAEKIMYTLRFDEIGIKDLPRVGGKNASLGEMVQQLGPQEITVPPGFSTTADAWWDYLYTAGIKESLFEILDDLDQKDFSNLKVIAKKAQSLIFSSPLPQPFQEQLTTAYQNLLKAVGHATEVAVRSSATAEDLPSASFAGLHDSFLNVVGEKSLIVAVHHCFASLFTERAIKYREDHGFDHRKVALCVGVQQMVRANTRNGSAGVAFTLDPETGFQEVIVINSAWGLGENVVQGVVTPDEFIMYKPNLRENRPAILSRKLGEKALKRIYADDMDHQPALFTTNVSTSPEEQRTYSLQNEKALKLAQWCLTIEDHYQKPMDIEWAIDGLSGELFILQARPETIHALKKPHLIQTHHLKEKATPLVTGIALGSKITSGKVRILKSPKDSDQLKPGEILVTDQTNPDWDPVMKKAGAIITNRGGRTSHAAIVAREIGIVAVVGTGNATEVLKNGQEVTVSCAEGKTGNIYDGHLKWEKETINTHKLKLPKTEVMLILGDPEKAFQYSFLPNQGIGLMRLEFVINNSIRIHPMALVKFDELEDKAAKMEIKELTRSHPDKPSYFIDLLSQAVGTIAAAFYPNDVIVRMSDFKTNEYANLIGGKQFEPEEENPMLGFRGASRYYSDLYKAGFRLECEAMKVVRNEMGFTNVKLMIPFCRTVEEGKKVLKLMESFGLKRGEHDLEIYVMVEIPSNVILADAFAEIFDGFSIGSNDLTQLTLGLDRDSALVSGLFNEQNDAVVKMIREVIQVAKSTGKRIGLCGQAPSDIPDFAQILVDAKIDSISFTPDALIRGIENVLKAENSSK